MAEQGEKTTEELMSERRVRTREFLNGLMKKNVEMKKAVVTAKERLQKWQTHELALKNSNEKLLLELKNLQTESTSLTEQIERKTEVHRKLDGEFKKYEEINNKEDENFWKSCATEMDEYRNLFIGAEAEYNTNSLKKDIEHYRELSKNVIEKIDKTKREIIELTETCGLTELDTTENANCLKDLQNFQKILMENDKFLSLSIRSAENTLQKIDSKLRQKRRNMEDMSRKME